MRSSLVVLLGLACGCAALVRPAPPPPGSPSAQRLEPGPYDVARRDVTFVRWAVPEGESPARVVPARRELRTSIWYPRDASGLLPLVVYSHGYMANRMGGAYLATHLASHGYVVAAPDHPYTRRWACDLRIEDVVNQPGDLRFVIDQLLDEGPDARPVPVRIDPERIGTMGLSLGGMTITMLAFDPDLGDPRIRAAVSMAGPLVPFQRAFFVDTPVHFLMIAGGADVIVEPEANAWPVLERVPHADLVMIAGASHAGFDDATTPPLPGMGNPDRFGCWLLAHNLELQRAVQTPAFRTFVREEEGMAMPAEVPQPCAKPVPDDVLDPRRQQWITALAVRAFFDAALAPDRHARHAGTRYLHEHLAADFPEVEVLRAPPGG